MSRMASMAQSDSGKSRRDEYAEATWQAVVKAAREMFRESGYSRTTVQQIARRARVSPATVYAQCGGKQGLLKTLMDAWTAGPRIREVIEASASAESATEKLRVLADGYLTVYHEWGDIMRIVTDAATAAPDAAEFLEMANARHHKALVKIVADIRKTGELQKGLSDAEAARIIFYHFRFEQLSFVLNNFGWSEQRARDWIRERVELALLRR